MDDRIHGKGKSVYANGNVYDGEWTDGRINGAHCALARTYPPAPPTKI